MQLNLDARIVKQEPVSFLAWHYFHKEPDVLLVAETGMCGGRKRPGLAGMLGVLPAKDPRGSLYGLVSSL